jgi:hypothetical protein
MIAIWLASTYGLMYVGFYLTVAACISLFALMAISKGACVLNKQLLKKYRLKLFSRHCYRLN